MAYHDEIKRHRYYCYASDAIEIVRWLAMSGYWFEHRHLTSGGDPPHEIVCAVPPDEIAEQARVNVQKT